MQNFHRKIKLKAFFDINEHISENKSEEEGPIVKSKSDWEPKKIHHIIQTSIEAINNDVNTTLQDKKNFQSIIYLLVTKKQYHIFQNSDDVTINRADKKEVTVILDIENYIA